MYVISCVIDDEWYYAGFKFWKMQPIQNRQDLYSMLA